MGMNVLFVLGILNPYRGAQVWLSEETVRRVLQWKLIVSDAHPKGEVNPVNYVGGDIKQLGRGCEVVPAIISDTDDFNWKEYAETRC